jgi:hypothetical protein
MTTDQQRDRVPEIVLRVPGPWKRQQEFEKSLTDDFRVEGNRLRTPEGRSWELHALPADREFPRIFRLACRARPLTNDEQSGLNRYAMAVAITGSSGSMQGARQLLEAGAGLVRAGGLGVFIDNSVLAHSGTDWLELAENRHDPSAVFYTFVNVAKLGMEIRSHGMHVFGQRDAVVAQEVDLSALEDFLRKTSADSPEFAEGDCFTDQRGKRYKLHAESDRGFFSPTHPVNNPYGRWRLDPV